MRIVTWNCARGPFAQKRAALDHLDADVVVMTEASRPANGNSDVVWFGGGKYGVALYARAPFTIQTLLTSDISPCVYPVQVDGPARFTLFGVWTWQAPTYLQALLSALDVHRSISGPRVVAGDFNGNVDFDKPRSQARWSDCFARLHADGLISAYHRNRPFGSEPHATHYFRWKEQHPFHLDYCFVPSRWTVETVSVGSYEEWAKLSDHRPVIVDVQVP